MRKLIPLLLPTWTFEAPSQATRGQVFGWWEKRRARYNALLLVVGVVSCLLALIAAVLAVNPGDDFVPLLVVGAIFLYGIMANVCYTLGPLIDIAFYRGRPRTKLLQMGLLFSVLLTALPGIVAILALLRALFSGSKL